MQNSSNSIKKIVVGIFERNGKVMIAQRAKKDALFGKWEFPGGKMEYGETEQETLTRELNEEFGINAQIGEHVCTIPFEHNNVQAEVQAYKITSFEGNIELREHSVIVWVEPSEIAQYDFPEPGLPIIVSLSNMIKK